MVATVHPTELPPKRQLRHGPEGAELVLPWEEISARCPDVKAYRKLQGFVRRGETVALTADQTIALDEAGPVAWSATRLVRINKPGGTLRSLAVTVALFDSPGGPAEFLKEQAHILGSAITWDGEFAETLHSAATPTQATIGLLAGSRILLQVLETASQGQPLFCGEAAVSHLLRVARANMSGLVVPPLAEGLPPRERTTPAPWHLLTVVRSEELAPVKRVTGGEFYNSLWFQTPPLLQSFVFPSERPWRMLLEMRGPVGTKFEIRTRVTRPDRPGWSREYSTPLQLSAPSQTVTFPDTLFGEEPGQPGMVEVILSFASPLEWVAKIEEQGEAAP